MNHEKIGKFIQTRRKELNMTQEDLAEKLMLTRMCVARWEYGHGIPSTDNLLSLSKVLGVSVQEILMGVYISKNEIVEKSEESIEVVFRYTKKQIQKIKMQSIILFIVFILIESATTIILNHPYYKNPEIFIDNEESIWNEKLPNHSSYETTISIDNGVTFKNPNLAVNKATSDFSDVISLLQEEFDLPIFNEKNYKIYMEYIDLVDISNYIFKKQSIDFKYFLNIYRNSLVQNN